ncbi:hypothetical protein Acor_21750 [Acrocarpospora corrugata]|uniref:ChsH2 rubredoxin-like zinc ribbon domain-containing protein n=1 Tax=Acrocarpospora corrugata TaxID=35763 RepID=A0A5M3VWP3_9ACTN|nr:zinc ribbon domain-containing protein [Acrocarpospora corrugata]GES00112.1 hypothetical protein Acor_21750 [Acrocarpospora corrugata]
MADRDSAQWWEALRRHEFVVQGCADCGRLRFPSRAYCAGCRSRSWRWQAVEPLARIESWIVTRGHTVVMVRLEAAADCVLYGHWRQPRAPRPGEQVHVAYEDADDVTVIEWRPGNTLAGGRGWN